MSPREEALVVATLEWLVTKALNAIRLDRDGDYQKMIFYITKMFPKLVGTQEELSRLVSDFRQGNVTWEDISEKYFILPLLNEGDKYVPMIKIKFDGPPNIGVSAGLFFIKGWQGDKPKSLGIRFEAPHTEGNGKHDYYHAQFNHDFKRDGLEPSFSIQPPNSSPAFPLFASNNLELFLSCLMSIYGKFYLKNDLITGIRDPLLKKVMSEWPPSAWMAN